MNDKSGWGLPGDGWTEPEAVDEVERYVSSGLLGAGGMGQVEAVWDRRLAREVARKFPSTELDPQLARAVLEHEARVTAALDHPNIVPLHDVGVLPDGRPWLSMRLVRGRRLSEVIDGAVPLAGLRLLLDVCRAVAHAHEQGVVHADLKPDNVIVGPHGEVQVVDWGLARFLDASRGERPVGVGGGTPPWRAPEVGAGAEPTRASDVYALGLMLDQVARAGFADVPRDLAAVARRATEAHAADRYTDAGQLAAELERWLDGLLVEAHTYSSTELFLRLVHAWRWPLALAFAVLVFGGGSAGLAAWQTARERDRAVAAEAELREVARTLYEDRAAAALFDGDDPEARAAAESALGLGPSIAATGVLAALGPLTAHRVSTAPLSCPRPLHLDADGVVCADGEATWRVDGEREIWRHAGGATDWMAAEDGGVALVDGRLERWVGEHIDVLRSVAGARGLVGGGLYVDRLSVTELSGLAAREPCPRGAEADTAAVDDGGWWVICRDGRLVRGEPGGLRDVAELGPSLGAVSSLVRVGDRLLAGTLRGRLASIDPSTGEVAVVDSPLTSVRGLWPSPNGMRVLAVDVRGATFVWHAPSGASGRLPVGPVSLARWVDDTTFELLTADGLETWTVEARGPRAWFFGEGLGAVAADGGAVAVAVGPSLALLEQESGVPTWRVDVHERVIKEVTFVGDEVVSGSVDKPDGMLRTDRRTGATRRFVEGMPGVRALAVDAEGTLLAVPYAPRVQRWESPDAPAHHATLARTPLAVRRAGDAVWVLDEDGRVSTLDGEVVVERPGARALAGGPWGAALLDGKGLVWLGSDGRVLGEQPVDGVSTALAVSSSGARAVVGFLDGSVAEIDRNEGLLWRARVHRERVSGLAAVDGGWLSVAWDGRVQQWTSAP